MNIRKTLISELKDSHALFELYDSSEAIQSFAVCVFVFAKRTNAVVLGSDACFMDGKSVFMHYIT